MTEGPDHLTLIWLQEQLGFTIERGKGHAFASIDCDERHVNPHRQRSVARASGSFAVIPKPE